MTARWVGALPDEPTTCSAAGAWPLLAILADAATGAARDEMAAAIGIDPADGTRAGLAVLDWLGSTEGLNGALGVWHRDELPIRSEWQTRMPSGVSEKFSGDVAEDQRALDVWTRDRTDGLIERMPVHIDDRTLLVLASALTVRTTWLEPFAGGGQRPLHRKSRDVSIVRAAPDVTCVRVEGDNGIDVQVVLGIVGAAAGTVLSRGLGLIAGPAADPATDPSDLSGPGLSVATVPSASGQPEVILTMPSFTVTGDHDLLTLPDVFGLATVTDSRHGHLPGISDVPLCVSAAKQAAVAEFSATGFRAAAVTAAGMVMAGMARPMREAVQVRITVDRPFGFFAVHRDTGLVLFAGWVTAAGAGS